jgi:hypothetical protein
MDPSGEEGVAVARCGSSARCDALLGIVRRTLASGEGE